MFLMNSINNVFVLKSSFGMVFHAWFNHNVVVEKYGIKKHFNVNVPHLSIGMEKTVFCVLMGKHGILPWKDANVDKELNGMDISVLWFKIVLEEWFGIKIHGLVSVHQSLYLMEKYA